jgi:hypothetical protein
MSKKVFGVYKSSTIITVEEIEETIDSKKFSYVVEIEFGPSQNGNGEFYMKIFTQGEFKEILSNKWRVNPLILCLYNWTNELAKIDIIDANGQEFQCAKIIDYRSIYKRNGDLTEGIKNVFRFISLLKNYRNMKHYLSENKNDE